VRRLRSACGIEQVELAEVLGETFQLFGSRRRDGFGQRLLIPIPLALAEMQAGLLELLPNPPLTRDQVRLLKTDKVVSGVEPTLGDLDIQPWPLEEFLAVLKDKYS
jgi:hypothetical protein